MAMFSSSSKYEEAAELLEKACNNYKLAKMWREAADGFALLADCHDKSDSKHDAATAHVDAANALKKIDVDAAVASLRVAVSMFQDMGRLSISAKHLKDIGETFEKADKLEGALDAYTQAADIYAAEESSSTANSCKLKVAEIAAVLERYPLAVECYEEVAKASMDNNLLRFSVKGYLALRGYHASVLPGAARGEERDGEVRGHRPELRRVAGAQAARGSRVRGGGGRRGCVHGRVGRVRLHVAARSLEDQDAASGEETHGQGDRGGGG